MGGVDHRRQTLVGLEAAARSAGRASPRRAGTHRSVLEQLDAQSRSASGAIVGRGGRRAEVVDDDLDAEVVQHREAVAGAEPRSERRWCSPTSNARARGPGTSLSCRRCSMRFGQVASLEVVVEQVHRHRDRTIRGTCAATSPARRAASITTDQPMRTSSVLSSSSTRNSPGASRPRPGWSHRRSASTCDGRARARSMTGW